LEGWTIQSDTAIGGPALWTGDSANDLYHQAAPIGELDATDLKPGSTLVKNDGFAQGRIDYTWTVLLSSTAPEPGGALGVLFRWVDENNYYRFSMFDGADQQQAYFRLIKVTKAATESSPTITVLQEEEVSSAFGEGNRYILTITADDLPGPVPVQTDIVIRFDSLDDANQAPFEWQLTDQQRVTAPLQANGYALYSSRNPGSEFNLVGIEGLTNSSQRTLETRVNGAGFGTVTGTIPGPNNTTVTVIGPGAPVTSLAPSTVVTLRAQAGTGSTFDGWRDQGGALLGMGKTLDVPLDQAAGVTKVVAGNFKPALHSLDIDGNQQISALTDGVLLVRYLFGVRDTALTQGALGPPPTNPADLPGYRTNPADIVNYLDGIKPEVLDVDGNGVASALQDGVMLVRYLFGVRDAALIQGALASNADGGRNTAEEIEAFIELYNQPISASSSTASEVLAQAGGQGLAASGEESSTVTSQSSFVSDNSTLTTQNSPLASEPSAISVSPDNSTLNTENSTFAPESGAVAAVQLSSASLRSAPWVADFLGTEEEEELLVML
jgi:hypothetical protein